LSAPVAPSGHATYPDLATDRDNRSVAKRVSSPELIGRTEELAALTAALERAGTGEFGAILIAGEAGVGKTRLVAELERHAATADGRVLAGDCIELAEGELPFAPLTAALRPLARELGPAELDALPGREELARLLPELGDTGERWISRDSALDEPLAQARLFEVLLALFTRLGEAGPVVLTIEDLHWADRSTRDFLSFLIRNAHDARLLLVCTYRSDELHRRHPLRPFVAELDRRAVVERVDLAPLSREELRGLLVAILGEEPSEALVGDMFERTDGNPFFAEELIAASAECAEIPATLRDALMVRVEALPQQARDILRVAAAAGRNVSHPLLAEVCELGGSELDEALREAVSSNVLVQDGDHYSFRHALVREAVSSDMLPGERTKLHAELAEALEADPSLGEGRAGAAAEVAHHWWEAKRLPEALSSTVAASRAAEEVYAFPEAHRFLEHALEIWDQVDDAEQRAGADRAEIFARASENANLIGELGRSVALARKAIELVDDDPVRLALLHERLGRYLWVTGDAEAALASYHEAVDLMPPEPPSAELARVLAAHGQILMLRGRPRESRRRCEQAIEVARSVGARAEEGHALNTLGVDISSLGDRKTGIAHLREAKRIVEELGWIDEIGRVYVNLSEEIDWDGRTADAVELTLEGAEAMQRLGARSYVVFLETEAAQRLVRLGRLDDADRAVRRALESGASGLGAAIGGDAEADVALARGDIATAREALGRAQSGLGRTRDSMYYGPTAAIEVEVALAESPEEAVRAFEAALERLWGEEYAFSTARLYARGIRAYAELAERARALGEDAALAAAERAATAALERFDSVLEPRLYEEGSPAPAPLAHRDVAAAELSRVAGRSDADAWAVAAERWEALAMPLERAYAEWRQAEALLLAGRARSEAGDLLSRAAASTREAGATALLGEIESLARRARLSLDGVQPVAAEDGDRDAADRLGLTERESEVLELVAQGCTNREIGEALFISQKTASVHVSRILGKLGVRGRVEAATKAQALGLVTVARS
jgi:DNA-binding CsgD family transcriptional regulator/tetratricopeptide (TPR) repeat protein